MSNDSLSQRRTYIYILRDPSGGVRYVGKADDPKRRLREHLSPKSREANPYKARWLAQLQAADLLPELEVVEEVGIENWEERERWWIAHYRSLGARLVNCTDGGDGVVGYKAPPELLERMAAFNRRINADPAVRAKRSESNKRAWADPEFRLRQKLAHANLPPRSEESRQRRGNQRSVRGAPGVGTRASWATALEKRGRMAEQNGQPSPIAATHSPRFLGDLRPDITAADSFQISVHFPADSPVIEALDNADQERYPETDPWLDRLTIVLHDVPVEIKSEDKTQNAVAELVRDVRTIFYALEDGTVCYPICGWWLHWRDNSAELAEEHHRIQTRNRRLNIEPPEGFISAVRGDLMPTPTPVPAPRPSAKPQALPPLLSFTADRIHKGAVEAFSLVERWESCDGFHKAHAASGALKDFAMLCGFPKDPGAEVWDFLMGRGEAAIKAHYALWARLYEQTGAAPGQWGRMNINQFCSDLGYKPHPRGGFKRERKQEAMRLLEVLTSVEIAVRFRVAGKKPQIREISGPLWARGLQGRQRDLYSDLFGQAREGDPSLWEPIGFTFGPGPWFADPAWRQQNQFLGLIGAGLMKLETHTDQTAIRIGGYLGTLARFDQYRTRRLKVATLLERIGMDRTYPRNPERLQSKIELAFEKLVEVNVIARWGYTDAEPSEPDMDDAEDLVTLAEFAHVPWRRKTLEVEWPAAVRAETKRLERAERKALATGNRRTSNLADTLGG